MGKVAILPAVEEDRLVKRWPGPEVPVGLGGAELARGGSRGQRRAAPITITADRVLAYVCHRQETEKAANATINRQLSALKRMFRLGEIAGKVTSQPHIEMLEENNVSKGFFEPEAFDAVLRHLPDRASGRARSRKLRARD
jgi:site-specific recombinase XerD